MKNLFTVIYFIIAVSFLFFCLYDIHKQGYRINNTKDIEKVNILKEGELKNYSIISFEFDGHRFITINKKGLIHHPDCPCHKP